MTNKIQYFAVLFTILFACAFLFPIQSNCRSYGSSSRSFGSSSFGSYKSKPSTGGSSSFGSYKSTTPLSGSFGSYKSKPSSPAVAGSASSSFGGYKGTPPTTIKQPSTTKITTSKPQSGRATLFGQQSQTRTQQNYRQQQSADTYGSSGFYGSSKPYRAPTPRQQVIVKKYYYGGQSHYYWYNHGHYYDPWSYSPTWWLLHWVVLEQQRELVNDMRFANMRAQVEAMRAQGVVPDAGYTENVAPVPITEPVRPISTHGFLFYLMWVTILLILAGIVTAFFTRRN